MARRRLFPFYSLVMSMALPRGVGRVCHMWALAGIESTSHVRSPATGMGTGELTASCPEGQQLSLRSCLCSR